MNLPKPVKPLLLALPTLMALTACSSFNGMFFQKDSGLHEVDDLLDQVERVRVDTELSKERMYDSLDMLNVILTPGFEGDIVAAYEEFDASIDRSEDQADDLGSSVKEMEDAAEEVFEQWNEDLEEFTSAAMRRRSRARFQETRERYEAILDEVLPALKNYEEFNESMSDISLFLGNDLNPSAISEIAGETRTMEEKAGDLDRLFDSVLAVTKAYVRSSAMPGQVEETQEPDPSPAKPAPKRPAGNAPKGKKAPARQQG